MAFCTNCGEKLEDNAKFCTNCGAKVEEPAAPENFGAENTQPEAENFSGEYAQPTPEQGAYSAPAQETYSAPEQGVYGAPVQGTYGAPEQGVYGAPVQGVYGAPAGGYYDEQKAAARKKKNRTIVIVICIVAVIAIAIIIGIVSLIVAASKEVVDSYNTTSYSYGPEFSSAYGPSYEPETDESGFTSPTTELKAGTYWYGFAEISNHSGTENYAEGIYEVWGVIGTDESGRNYFELFDNAEMEDPILSYWVDISYDYAQADIGEEDAWLLNIYLLESDEAYFSFWLENGAISIWFPYQFEGEYFDFDVFLREEGTEWDAENDPYLP